MDTCYGIVKLPPNHEGPGRISSYCYGVSADTHKGRVRTYAERQQTKKRPLGGEGGGGQWPEFCWRHCCRVDADAGAGAASWVLYQ